jgi:hypothetical protein
MHRTRRELHGVFLGSHAVAAGEATAKQLKSRLYRRLLHNVYANPGLVADHQLRAIGASLVMPPDGVLGGRSAAAWYDAPFASPQEPVLVIVPPESPWRGPRGVQVHRTPLARQEWVIHEDVRGVVRLTTPIRTAWEIATLEATATAVGYLDAMVRFRHLDQGALQRLAFPGRWRSTRAAKVFPLVDGASQSPPESWVRVACVLAGLPAPVPQYVVIAAGQFLGKTDLAWPAHRLIVEYEGPHHFDEKKQREDDLRYAALVAAGWRVIRLTTADLRDMAGVVARIAAALGQPVAAS